MFMNQILVTENITEKRQKVKSQKAGEINIESIIKFFAITIIIFGLVLSGNGSYALIKDIQNQKTKDIPVVTTERKGNSLKLVVKNNVGIKSIKYSWNDSTEKVVSGKNLTELTTTINIITGNNKLNITVIDTNNNSTQYVKNYIQEEQDTTNPMISIANEDPKIKVTVTDDTALDYVIYKYGDNEEKTVTASADEPTKIEFYIEDVEEAELTLTVEAVDKAQNTASAEQKVKGATKSTIDVVPDPTDPSYLIIKVNDNDGIRMIVFYLNEQEYKTDPNISLNTKEFEYRVKVDKGTTTVKVNAYNLSEQITEFSGIYTLQ